MPVANGSPLPFLHCFFLSDPTPSLTFFGWPFIIQDIRMSFSSSSSTPTSSPTSISSSSSPRMPSQHSHLFSHDLARRNFSFPSEKLNHNPTTSAACSIARRRWVKRGALLLLAICFASLLLCTTNLPRSWISTLPTSSTSKSTSNLIDEDGVDWTFAQDCSIVYTWV